MFFHARKIALGRDRRCLIFAVLSTRGGDRQLIYTGWDCPTPATFRADVADFEKLNGTVGQTIPVKPGEMYVVVAKVKETGPGEAGLLINWQENGKWVAQSERVEFVPADAPDAEGWRSIAGLVSVPPEATALSFLIFARRQDMDKGEALFKDPVVAQVSK